MKTWVEAAKVSEFNESDRKLVDLGGSTQIGLFKVDGEFLAVSAWCTHQRAIMVQGSIDDCELMCPLHGARFDLRTGEALSLPAVEAVKTYKVKVVDDTILVKV